MNIVLIYADSPQEWNCSEWRIAVPYRALVRQGVHRAAMLSIQDFASRTPQAEALVQSADVIVFQRNATGLNLVRLAELIEHHTILIDFDDAYDLMPPTNVSYRYWGRNEVADAAGRVEFCSPPAIEQFKQALALADGFITPSRQLCQDWERLSTSYYQPNYVDVARYAKARRKPHAGIVIGWGGSMSHVQSFRDSGIGQALKRVCVARPEVTIQIHTAEQATYDSIPVPPERKRLVGWKPADEWPGEVINFDLGLAPLHGAYDDRRSWIKILEYSLLRVPWVATDSVAYREWGQYGALVRNSPKAWERAILETLGQIGTPEMERRLDVAQAWARAQDINLHVEDIVDVYHKAVYAKKGIVV